MFPSRRLQGKGTRVNRRKKGAVLLGHLLGYNGPFVCGRRGISVGMSGHSLRNARIRTEMPRIALQCLGLDARSRTVGNVKEKSRARNMCHRFAMG
jgi:hypothetical protein